MSAFRYIIVGAVILSCVSAYAGIHADEDSLLQTEADAFLINLPSGMQARQTEAIRAALSGDFGALESVRNTRKAASPLPEGVVRSDVGAGLTLFRSDRYVDRRMPLLVYYHGGGWTIGSINSCSRYCGAMADNGITVLAVDYRLAPEHPYPQGLEDCVAAARFALDHQDDWNVSGISLGGDSSGGNLAIATAMRFPEDTFSSLVLFYPVTLAYADGSVSWRKYGEGYGLDATLMDVFNDAYTSDVHNPFVSPLEADMGVLSQLPPTLLVAAERDILRCQGAEFADTLQVHGVPVKYHLLPGTVHLFITVDGQPTAFRRAVRLSSEYLLDSMK